MHITFLRVIVINSNKLKFLSIKNTVANCTSGRCSCSGICAAPVLLHNNPVLRLPIASFPYAESATTLHELMQKWTNNWLGQAYLEALFQICKRQCITREVMSTVLMYSYSQIKGGSGGAVTTNVLLSVLDWWRGSGKQATITLSILSLVTAKSLLA
jgi:hypothetical protein